MSFCVPEWGTRSGGMLNAVTPANDFPQLAPKGRGDSIRHQKAHLPDLASVPDQDSLELAWMENGDAENGHFDMQCPTSEGCNSELQVNYSTNWGIGHGMEDTGLPSKLPGMLVNEPSLATAGDQALPIINIQDDEMISWLQDPPEDSLDQNYGVDLFGELPVTNIQVFADAFSGQGMIGRSARMQPSGISGNTGNSALATRDVNADMAMTLGACRAAGLIRQGAGVEAFSQVRTLQPLGTRQPPGITSSSSPSLNQGITETENPFRNSSPMSGSLLVPMLPPKSKPVAAATFNNLPSNNPLVEKSGAMNFPVFARPAALMKANLQSLNMTSILPSNLMRFKSQQGRLVNLEASMSTSSSITELTTRGQTCASQPHRDGSLQTQNELEMQFGAATASHQSPNVGVDSLSPMASSVSRKEVQAVAASAGKATYCGTEPKDQDTSHHSSGTTGSAGPTLSDVGVSQTTSIPEVQEPTITSGSGGATVQAYSDPGALQGTSVPEVQEPTITSALGGSGDTGLKRVVKEISSAANKKSKKLHVVEEVECTRAEHDSLDVKKPTRGSTAKRNRAAEVHNLSERRRRDRINEKMKSLQELIPNSNKTDKASMLDEAIEYIKMLKLQLQMMSMRSGVNLPPMVLPSGIQCMQMPQMPQMPMSMGVGMGMGMGFGMGMMDMGATGSGQGVMPAMSFMGPVPPNRGVPSMMAAETRDACLVNANMMDPRKAYLTHQHQAMQIQQPMTNEMYNAYILQQHQQQQQQQYQQYQLQQEHHQSFTMAAGPSPL